MTNKYKPLIAAYTQKYLGRHNYDPRLVAAQIKQESAFNPNAKSPVGAMGLMQIMPATWEEEAARIGLPPNSNPYDVENNIAVGCSYMGIRMAKWGSPRPDIDRICLALASYNAGFGHLLKAQRLAGGVNDYASIIARLPEVTGHHSKETIQYVERILKYYNEYVTEGW